MKPPVEMVEVAEVEVAVKKRKVGPDEAVKAPVPPVNGDMITPVAND